jgi:hypothetical protein
MLSAHCEHCAVASSINGLLAVTTNNFLWWFSCSDFITIIHRYMYIIVHIVNHTIIHKYLCYSLILHIKLVTPVTHTDTPPSHIAVHHHHTPPQHIPNIIIHYNSLSTLIHWLNTINITDWYHLHQSLSSPYHHPTLPTITLPDQHMVYHPQPSSIH